LMFGPSSRLATLGIATDRSFLQVSSHSIQLFRAEWELETDLFDDSIQRT
jgi:hypothetical protein